jgi:hypothetical protein
MSWSSVTIAASSVRSRQFEGHRDGIHAVATAYWFRAIIEDMAELAAATAAVNSCPHHAERGILGHAEGLVNCAQKLGQPVLPSNLVEIGRGRSPGKVPPPLWNLSWPFRFVRASRISVRFSRQGSFNSTT